MTEKDREKELLWDAFKVAFGELTTSAMEDLSDEVKLQVGAAVTSGAATIQLAVSSDPVAIVAFLRMRDGTGTMRELFRITDGQPSVSTN